MRIGVRFAVSGLVLASIIVSAAGVHLLWWRTAQQVSQTLANTINDQIVSAVSDELQSITSEAKSAYAAVRTLLVENVIDTSDANKRQFMFLSQLQAQPTISWVAFGFPDGSFSASHKLGDSAIEMLDIDARKELRISRALDPFFRLLDTRFCQWEMELQHKQLTALVLMGPSARHIEVSTLLGAIAGLESPLRVTGAVNLHVYQPAKP